MCSLLHAHSAKMPGVLDGMRGAASESMSHLVVIALVAVPLAASAQDFGPSFGSSSSPAPPAIALAQAVGMGATLGALVTDTALTIQLIRKGETNNGWATTGLVLSGIGLAGDLVGVAYWSARPYEGWPIQQLPVVATFAAAAGLSLGFSIFAKHKVAPAQPEVSVAPMIWHAGGALTGVSVSGRW
jgi:hypothetical protein